MPEFIQYGLQENVLKTLVASGRVIEFELEEVKPKKASKSRCFHLWIIDASDSSRLGYLLMLIGFGAKISRSVDRAVGYVEEISPGSSKLKVTGLIRSTEAQSN
ncbi:hypothetical protein [Microbulbifer sp. DLAB2-AA]|uniref:hypothetical protein n=1 Tax=Microbulbifer sp. DLAB2-AA TaxID=3243394 RepID=UPI00403A7028